MLELDIQQANESLRDADPAGVVRWALDLDVPTIATTSMGRNAAVMLHLVSQVNPELGRMMGTTEAGESPTRTTTRSSNTVVLPMEAGNSAGV